MRHSHWLVQQILPHCHHIMKLDRARCGLALIALLLTNMDWLTVKCAHCLNNCNRLFNFLYYIYIYIYDTHTSVHSFAAIECVYALHTDISTYSIYQIESSIKS